MKKLRTDLQQKFSGINYAMAALGLIPRSAPIEITLSGSSQENVMANGLVLKKIIENVIGRR